MDTNFPHANPVSADLVDRIDYDFERNFGKLQVTVDAGACPGNGFQAEASSLEDAYFQILSRDDREPEWRQNNRSNKPS